MGNASATDSISSSVGRSSIPPILTYSFSATSPVQLITESGVMRAMSSTSAGHFSFSTVICSFPVMSLMTIKAIDLPSRMFSTKPETFAVSPHFVRISLMKVLSIFVQ